MLTSKPGSGGLRSSGDSLPQLEFNRRTAAGGLRPAYGSRPVCIPTTAASAPLALETNMSNQNHSRQRSKIRGFIIAETFAIGILLLAGAFVLSARPVEPTVLTAVNIVMVAAAGGVATIPIFFFALAPILPRSRR